MSGPHSDLSPHVHDDLGIAEFAWLVSVVVEAKYGDRELSVGLPFQSSIHEMCGAVVRFSFKPSFYVGVHIVREGDGGDTVGGIALFDIGNYRKEVL